MGTLRACDVMTRNLVVLSEDDSIHDAVTVLKERHIHGAPVVNADGVFVGILSISDLVDRETLDEDENDEPEPLAHGEGRMRWDLFDKAAVERMSSGGGTVSECMTRTVTTVTQVAPLVEVARVMCSGHWHRVPVVDDGGKLCGIISSMDVLAAIVNVADELS